jgi:hypothetical protein
MRHSADLSYPAHPTGTSMPLGRVRAALEGVVRARHSGASTRNSSGMWVRRGVGPTLVAMCQGTATRGAEIWWRVSRLAGFDRRRRGGLGLTKRGGRSRVDAVQVGSRPSWVSTPTRSW